MKFFEELPRTPTRIDWKTTKEQLVKNEGQWGLIAENVSGSTPQQLNRGLNKLFRGDELKHFEFRTSKPENPPKPYPSRRTDLYGRYTSKPKEGE